MTYTKHKKYDIIFIGDKIWKPGFAKTANEKKI